MLNTTVDFSNEVTFNSVGGTLVKSCSESKFVRFNMKSKLAECFFDLSNPTKDGAYNSSNKVSVLQVMLCGGDNFLVEYVEIKGE